MQTEVVVSTEKSSLCSHAKVLRRAYQIYLDWFVWRTAQVQVWWSEHTKEAEEISSKVMQHTQSKALITFDRVKTQSETNSSESFHEHTRRRRKQCATRESFPLVTFVCSSNALLSPQRNATIFVHQSAMEIHFLIFFFILAENYFVRKKAEKRKKKQKILQLSELIYGCFCGRRKIFFLFLMLQGLRTFSFSLEARELSTKHSGDDMCFSNADGEWKSNLNFTHFFWFS